MIHGHIMLKDTRARILAARVLPGKYWDFECPIRSDAPSISGVTMQGFQ